MRRQRQGTAAASASAAATAAKLTLLFASAVIMAAMDNVINSSDCKYSCSNYMVVSALPHIHAVITTPRGGSTMTAGDEVVDDEDIDYKANDEWWKDPLAMFDDPSPASAPAASVAAAAETKRAPEPDSTVKEVLADDTPMVVEEMVSFMEDKNSAEGLKPDSKAKEKQKVEKQKKEKQDKAAKVKKEKQTKTKEAKPKKEQKPKKKKESSNNGLFGVSKDKKPRGMANSKAGGGGVSPLALVAPVLPKLKSLVALHPAAAKVFGLVALGTGVSNVLLRKNTEDQELDLMKKDEAMFHHTEETDNIDLDQVLYEERQRERRVRHHGDEIEDDVLSASESSLSDDQLSTPTKKTETSACASDEHTPQAKTGLFGLGGSRNEAIKPDAINGKIPNKRKLWEQVQELHGKLQSSESSKAKVDSDYEKASLELQKAASEVTNLKSTTTYLKSQLAENEEMLKRAVQTERRKAQEELMRLKNSMVQVVERERQSMRDEFRKQAGELETLMLSKKEQQQQQQQLAISAAPAREQRRQSRSNRNRVARPVVQKEQQMRTQSRSGGAAAGGGIADSRRPRRADPARDGRQQPRRQQQRGPRKVSSRNNDTGTSSRRRRAQSQVGATA